MAIMQGDCVGREHFADSRRANYGSLLTLMNSFWALQMEPHWSLLFVQNSQFTCRPGDASGAATPDCCTHTSCSQDRSSTGPAA